MCSPSFGLFLVQGKRKQGSYLFLYNLGEESKEKEEKKKQVRREGIKVWDSLEYQFFMVCVVGNCYLVCGPLLWSFV